MQNRRRRAVDQLEPNENLTDSPDESYYVDGVSMKNVTVQTVGMKTP